MYNEFMNKSDHSILDYMEKLGRDPRIYSEKRRGLGPLLTQYDFYVFATERELALVLIDLGTEDEVSPKKELISDLHSLVNYSVIAYYVSPRIFHMSMEFF